MQATNTYRRRVVTLATAIFATFIIGVAFAAWTATGTGTGQAQAGQSGALGTANAGTLGTMVPSTSVHVALRVSNDNPFDVDLTDITNYADITSDKAGCNVDTADVEFNDLTEIVAGTYVIAKNATNQLIVLEDALSMGADSANACKGARFTIPVQLDGLSTGS